MKTAEILHAVLILAPVFPLIMMLHPDRAESMLFPAYVLGWMILPFAAIMRYAVWKTRLYGQYLLVCAACMACAAGLAHLAGRLLFPRAATAAGTISYFPISSAAASTLLLTKATDSA